MSKALFSPPQPVHPWPGVRPATAYGNRCPQLPSGNGPRSDSEDCLYLNVFTPPGAAAHPDGWLPVLVMIHGRGLVNGAGDQHDGSLIVTTDHIIVVSINPPRTWPRSPAVRRRTFTSSTRNAPGLNRNLPGSQWGAGHAVEFACGRASTTATRSMTCSPRRSSSCPGRW